MKLPFITGLILLALTAAWPGRADACTTFCMDTPHGPVFGANLDLFIPGDGLVFINRRGVAKEGFQAGTTGRKAKWISKYGSVTFNLAGREFAFGGMNEAGLTVGSMELLASEFPEPDERPGVNIGLWAQYVLDTCATIEEAIAVNAEVRMEDSAPPIHFLVADPSGRCATIEWFDGEYTCRYGDDVPVRAMSNMPYGRALEALNRGGPRWWWSNPGASAERFAAAHRRSMGYDAEKDPDAIKYAFDTLVYAVGAPHTKWSIVYDLAKREVWYGTVVSREAKHISLSSFDLSCGAPPLMLDVNAQLAGDVEEHFMPFDFDINLAVFRTLCARYGIDISEDDSLGLMRHLARFDCAPANTAAKVAGDRSD